MAKVVVIGGGYSGLACLIELSRRDRSLELHLIDGRSEHVKVTNLHKSFRDPAPKYSVPFATLAKKFHFKIHQQSLDFSQKDLLRWQKEKKLSVKKTTLDFDYLVVCTGARPRTLSMQKAWQDDLWSGGGKTMIEDLVSGDPKPVMVTVVGGGATGIQFLFELHQELRKKKVNNTLRLIDLNPQLVPELPRGVHAYIEKKLRQAKIEYLPETRVLGHEKGQLDLEETTTGRVYQLPCDRTLFFPGVTPSPQGFEANQFGQIQSGRELLRDIFTAGDCSRYDSSGLNALTAQAAVRKGKLVARNIRNLITGRPLQAYRYREKGYLVSLGALDAVGWVGLRCNLAKGFPASLLKDTMETQWDLYLQGVDTFVDLP